MKKFILLSVIAILLVAPSFGQSVGIGTTTPNASSMLEIKADNKGLLIPRTSTASRTAIVNPAKGLMVYDTTSNNFWYHNGSAWVQITPGISSWSTTGNSGTDTALNFIGNVDNHPLIFKVNGQRAAFLDNGTSGNVSFGYNALQSNTTGAYNTANGEDALHFHRYGNSNTANGYQALYSDTVGAYNTASGYQTLYSNKGGTSNSANGVYALYSNTNGSNNTANGVDALYSNTNGSGNTANGIESLHYNTTGNGNTASGAHALFLNTSGTSNTADGTEALSSNTTGSVNTANGGLALLNNTTAWYNTANGYQSLYSNTTGSNNTAYGYRALYSNVAGFSNTALGNQADVSTDGLSNATAIGANASVSISNALVLGHNAFVGIGTSAPNAPLHISTGFSSGITTPSLSRTYFYIGTGTSLVSDVFASGAIMVQADGWYWANGGGFVATSDARIKDIIGVSDNERDLETLSKIQVTDYKYIDKINNGDRVNKKVIAQQLKEVYPSAVGQNEGVIPNVYAIATSVTVSGQTTVIKTKKANDFITGDIVRLIIDNGEQKMMPVTAIDSYTFSVAEKISGKVFVYGKKVKDLLNVDYDALSMLNISATQELIKKVDALETQNSDLKQKTDKIAALESELEKLNKMVEQLQKIQYKATD